MSRFRCYMKPFDFDGNYKTAWQEITEDVDFNGLGRINRQIDGSEYNVGILQYNNMKLNLRNEHGHYSDVEETRSIFDYKRSESQFKITWSLDDGPNQCGLVVCGEFKSSEEIDVYRGLINDDSATSNIKDQKISFQVLGIESVFTSVEFPYTTISNGDLISSVIYDTLNQAKITNLMTVSASNINPGTDVVIDDKTDLENTTAKEALDQLLEISNSVLYIEDDVVYVKDRDPAATVSKTFFGQASFNGIEDIISIKNLRSGVNRVFNYWTWAETSLISKWNDTINVLGIKKKEVDFAPITNNTRRQTILDNLKTEFGPKQQELDLEVPLAYPNLALSFLDRTIIDYPTVLRSATSDGVLPLYGVAIYGEATYPYGEWGITIATDINYKIMGITIDPKKQTITFKKREI